MRVLHVSDCYLPRLGGIETQVHHLALRQRAAGTDAGVLTATPRARHDRRVEEVIDGVPVRRASADLPFELPVHPRTGAQVAAALERARAEGRPVEVAHVHAGVISPFAYAAVPALLAAGVPVVVSVHSMWGPAGGLLRPLDRVLGWSRRPVVFSAVSAVAAEPLRRVGAEVRVLPNGIDPCAGVPLIRSLRQAITGFTSPRSMRTSSSPERRPVSTTSCGWVRWPMIALLMATIWVVTLAW